MTDDLHPLFRGWRVPPSWREGPARVVIAYRHCDRVYRDRMTLGRYAAYRAEMLSRAPHRYEGHPAVMVGDLTKG